MSTEFFRPPESPQPFSRDVILNQTELVATYSHLLPNPPSLSLVDEPEGIGQIATDNFNQAYAAWENQQVLPEYVCSTTLEGLVVFNTYDGVGRVVRKVYVNSDQAVPQISHKADFFYYRQANKMHVHEVVYDDTGIFYQERLYVNSGPELIETEERYSQADASLIYGQNPDGRPYRQVSLVVKADEDDTSYRKFYQVYEQMGTKPGWTLTQTQIQGYVLIEGDLGSFQVVDDKKTGLQHVLLQINQLGGTIIYSDLLSLSEAQQPLTVLIPSIGEKNMGPRSGFKYEGGLRAIVDENGDWIETRIITCQGDEVAAWPLSVPEIEKLALLGKLSTDEPVVFLATELSEMPTEPRVMIMGVNQASMIERIFYHQSHNFQHAWPSENSFVQPTWVWSQPISLS